MPPGHLSQAPSPWRATRRRAWLLIAFAIGLAGCAPDAPDVNWPAYLGDEARTHYSPLTDIDPSNVASLEVAWRYDAGELAPGISVMDTSPLVVDGVLYGLSPTLDAFALNAATGEELWRHEIGDAAIGHSQRGLLWWSGEQAGVGNRLFYVAGAHLIGLDPDTGQPLAGFGEGGRFDLSSIFGAAPTVQGPGLVVGDQIVLGLSDGGSDGLVMAVDVVDGAVAWRTLTNPVSGGAPAASMALDVAKGLVFVPTEAAMPMAFGPESPSGDLNASGVLALDASTGETRWFQPIYARESWPGRLAAPPTLVALERDGVAIEAVPLATRRGHLYLLDRETGEPLTATTEHAGQGVSTLTFTRQSFALSERRPGAGAAVANPLGTARHDRLAGLPGHRRRRRLGRRRLRAHHRHLDRQRPGNRERPSPPRNPRRFQRQKRLLRPLRPLPRRRPQRPVRGPGRTLRRWRPQPHRRRRPALPQGHPHRHRPRPRLHAEVRPLERTRTHRHRALRTDGRRRLHGRRPNDGGSATSSPTPRPCAPPTASPATPHRGEHCPP